MSFGKSEDKPEPDAFCDIGPLDSLQNVETNYGGMLFLFSKSADFHPQTLDLRFVRRLIACYCRRHYIWFYLLGVFLIMFASLQIMFSYVF